MWHTRSNHTPRVPDARQRTQELIVNSAGNGRHPAGRKDKKHRFHRQYYNTRELLNCNKGCGLKFPTHNRNWPTEKRGQVRPRLASDYC